MKGLSVYHKAASADQILNFGSNGPALHNSSCDTTVLDQLKTHCSTREARVKQLIRLYRMFRRNGYRENSIGSGQQMIRKAHAQCGQERLNLSPTLRMFLRWWHDSWSHSAQVLHIHQLRWSSKAYHDPEPRWIQWRNQIFNNQRPNL